jgi:hypothetical protein
MEPCRTERVAIHEAGHAVVARLHRLPVASVTIYPRGRVRFVDPITRDPWAALMTYLASAAAEMRAFGDADEVGCGADTTCARGYADILGEDDRAAVLADATTRCRSIVDRHWAEIERVALQVLASPNGVLAGADITTNRKAA